MFEQSIHLNGWVNGDLYVPTKEVIGILPIPDDVRTSSGMVSYRFALNEKQKHSFVARMQNTRRAVLPVHTPAEQQLYQKLMETNTVFSPKSGEPQWREAVVIWNQLADGTSDEVYYKLVEQLKVYHAKWKALSNVHTQLSRTAETRRPLYRQIHDPRRALMVPPTPTNILQPHQAKSGFALPPVITSTPEADGQRYFPGMGALNLTQLAPSANNKQLEQLHVIGCTPSFTLTPTSSSQSPEIILLEQEIAARAQQRMDTRKKQMLSDQGSRKRRKKRTCRKCGKPDCKGSRAVSDCSNPCQDCGNVNCRGRNTHRPTLPCSQGWEA
ncbi:hypothetical protein AGABI2DRAFT_152387 [Agaricus bisporus var. bisporus H97]|uniref:hypothetical protein n=1 Tax=Agaricus bisporus var. bisporus (strain H97 / ATCC MYA-4626 / FGSC 10389) TaxID=936046 RepID=UPI00029F7A77|nr:hypothetical protein AGABI2DRAFT_152387 [Agaricus bisporus var. bisporus H97]EKV44941.1 hypothetical protein AGABI2DRAFT_152387 [Agaricus bisporus var. bisporus H97]